MQLCSYRAIIHMPEGTSDPLKLSGASIIIPYIHEHSDINHGTPPRKADIKDIINSELMSDFKMFIKHTCIISHLMLL